MSGSPGIAASRVTWRVLPVRTPHVVRACPRCNGQRAFASSDRFRVNASGRRLDVWLIYRCAACDFTWNLTVLERSTPEAIGAAALEGFLRNDPGAARACAFDDALLRRAGVQLERSPAIAVERAPLPAGWVTVQLALPFPVQVRLDRLLAQELRVPRSRIGAHVDSARGLRRRVVDGQVVRLLALEEVPDPARGARGALEGAARPLLSRLRR
jgi:hypothetical protein